MAPTLGPLSLSVDEAVGSESMGWQFTYAQLVQVGGIWTHILPASHGWQTGASLGHWTHRLKMVRMAVSTSVATLATGG